MTNIKERILGAITVMNDEDAEKVWDLIQGSFNLANAEVVAPDEMEVHILNTRKDPSSDYYPSISHEELLKELDL